MEHNRPMDLHRISAFTAALASAWQSVTLPSQASGGRHKVRAGAGDGAVAVNEHSSIKKRMRRAGRFGLPEEKIANPKKFLHRSRSA